MQELKNSILCFHRPKAGAYIGGLVTLCNDYIDKSSIFEQNGIKLSSFNYEIKEGTFWDFKKSKIRNLAYVFLQIKALKRYLKDAPETTVHIHTSRKALFIKDVILADKVRKNCKGKILLTIHVGDINTVFHNKHTRRFLIRIMNRSVDRVLFLSEHMRQQFISAGLEEKRATVLYNFYNIKSTSPERKEKKSVPQLLYIGSINREKGIVELLTALAESSANYHLNLCGTIIEESIRTEFERLTELLGDKVTYHGYVGKDKKEELMKETDILILPSYREGLPISILEAMANSCAIVTTPVGAIPEVLGNDNALFVNPRDKEGLKKAVERLIADETLRSEMQEANFKLSENYSAQTHIELLCRMY